MAEEPAVMDDTDSLEMEGIEANEDIFNYVMNNENTKTAPLENVRGGEATGTGYVLREGNVLSHTVTSNLPDPADGNFYEGWLVQQQPLQFISTGEMEKNENGDYILSFRSEEGLYEGYDFVVITEETIRDDTPEKHVIEGLAE